MQLRLSARPLMQHSQWQKSNFQIHNLLVFMKKKSLSNSKMGKLVARLLGRTELEVKDGKVELTSEERRIVVENYGQAFLDKLDSVELSEDEDALDLFNAAVAAKVAESRTEMEATVKRLQEDILRLSQEPEPTPMANKKELQGARTFAVNMAASHNRLVSQALASDNPMVFAALENGTVDVADLNKEFSMTMPPKVKLDLLAKRLYLGFNDMVEALDNSIQTIRRDDEKRHDLEIRILQEQINPHFLYNTLDAIVWMAEGGEDKEVVAMVTALSQFFRTTTTEIRTFPRQIPGVRPKNKAAADTAPRIRNA